MLTMSFTLLRNGIPLLTRGPEKHWWLTGFKWGVYSQPEELVVRASLVLPVPDMRQAFTTALAAMGYPYQVHGDTVTFDFAKPVTHQPRLTNPIHPAVEVEDQAIVAAYEGFGMPNNDPNQVGAALANRIEGMVLGKSTNFLGQAFAAAFKEAGEAADQVAKVLANELDLAATTVVSWVTDAGYGLRDWIESLYTAVEETFTMNFSCAIEIDNVAYGGRLPAQLTRTDFGVKERSIFKVKCGHYFVEPPVTIRPGTLTRFYLKDNFGYEGAEGWATYTYLDESNRQRTVTFTYGCPTSTDDNYARCDDPSFRVYARSGDSLAWRTSVPGSGHPLSVACVFNSGPAPS